MPRDSIRGRNITALLDDLSMQAGRIVEQAFPSRLKLCAPAVHPNALSQARNESRVNAAYRHACYQVALFLAGWPESHADLLIDFQRDVKRMLWSPGTRPVAVVSLEEQHTEGVETALQLAYGSGDTSVRGAWLVELRRERAITDELIAALEAEERSEKRLAA